MPAMSAFDHSDLDGRSAAAAGGGGRGALGDPRGRAAGRHAVGGEPPAGQAAHHRRRPAGRASGRGIVPRRGPRAGRARPRAAGRPARFAAPAASTRPPAGRSPSPPTTCSATCCCRRCCARLRSRRTGRDAARDPVGRARPELLREACQLSSRRARPTPPTWCRSACSPTATASSTTPACARAARLDDYLAPSMSPWSTDGRRLDIDQLLVPLARPRRVVASVPGFAGMPPFLRGSARLATAARPAAAGAAARLGAGRAAAGPARDADVHGLACAPPGRPDAPLAARRTAGGGRRTGSRMEPRR
jgi:hypothetical protein